MTESEHARRRDASATRAALLSAARRLFIERGFDRTTVRDIASAAGVNQALLFRYFGSKDAIFEAAMAGQSEELLEDTSPDKLVGQALARIFGKDVPDALDNPIFALLRSSGHEQTSVVFKEHLGARYRAALASLTDAEDAEMRADLVLAWLLGLGLLRQVLHHKPVADADPNHVSELVLQAVGTLLERVDRTPQEVTGPGD